jgi:hypothetical protein
LRAYQDLGHVEDAMIEGSPASPQARPAIHVVLIDAERPTDLAREAALFELCGAIVRRRDV